MVSHLLPNKASIATLRCLRRVPSHIRTDWFWHPSQHIHNAVLLLGGLDSLLSHNTLSARTFPWTMGTTSIQDYDTLKTRLPTHEFAHKPIDSDKDTEVCAYYTRNQFSCKVNTNFQDAWGLLMEPVVAAANLEIGYGLSGVRLPPVVSSRVGVCSIESE